MADSAEAAFDEALKREPGFLGSIAARSALPYYRGDLEGALADLDAFVKDGNLAPDREYFTYRSSFVPLGIWAVLYESGRYRQLFDAIDAAGRLRRDPVDRFYHQRYRCQNLLRLGRGEEVLQWVEAEAEPLAAGEGVASGNLQLQGIARWAVRDFRAKALVTLDSLDAAREATAELMAAAAEFGNHARLQALRDHRAH